MAVYFSVELGKWSHSSWVWCHLGLLHFISFSLFLATFKFFYILLFLSKAFLKPTTAILCWVRVKVIIFLVVSIFPTSFFPLLISDKYNYLFFRLYSCLLLSPWLICTSVCHIPHTYKSLTFNIHKHIISFILSLSQNLFQFNLCYFERIHELQKLMIIEVMKL